MARGQQSPAQGVADDDDPKSVEQRVEPALQSRIGNIEQVERVSEGFQREQRQNGEHQDRPGGGDGAAQPTGPPHIGIARDYPPRDPLHRRPRRRDRQRHREQAERLRRRDPRRQAVKPIAKQGPEGGEIAGRFARHPRPQQGTDQARRASEGFAREEIAPRRADSRVVVVDLQQHGARRAHVGVEVVVLFLFGGQFRARRIAERRVLGFGRQLGEPLARSLEARSEVGDHRLQFGDERIAFGAQPHQIGVAEIVGLQLGFDVGERRTRSVEGLARRVVAGRVRRRRQRDQRREKQQSKGAKDGQMASREMIRRERRFPRIRPWPPCGRNDETAANARSVHLGAGKGLRPARGFVKEASK